MRKHLIIPSVLAILILGLGANLALAGCGGCGSKAAAAEATTCSDHADMSAAECAAACAAKSAAACSPEAAAACATKGAASCGTKGAQAHAGCSSAASAASCGSKGAQAHAGCSSSASAASCAAKGDFFISNYMGLRAAMDKNCNHSMTSAATAYRTGLQNMIASGQADEHREALTSLAAQLDNWPADAKDQQARFGEISEWVAAYCEMFPEKTAGAKVVTCPTSGHRWVEIAADGAEDQS
jgi:hypothetical protein